MLITDISNSYYAKCSNELCQVVFKVTLSDNMEFIRNPLDFCPICANRTTQPDYEEIKELEKC